MKNKPYLPSNGSEGTWFTGKWCDNCANQNPDPDQKPQCDDILLKSLTGEQPSEWIYKDGVPVCTAFRPWDWDEGEPEEVIPVNPNQLNLF